MSSGRTGGDRQRPDPPDAHAVAEAFGLGSGDLGLSPVVGAHSHRMWRLRTADGGYAVKQFLNPWGDPDWQDWLRVAADFELTCHDAGIAMPTPVPARTGAVLAEVATTTGEPTTVRVHRWLDAVPCPDGPAPGPIAFQVGAVLAAIHALDYRPVRRDVFPHPDRATVDGWPGLVDRLRETDRELAAEAAGCADLVRAVGDLFPLADPSDEPMGHGDVAGKNVLIMAGRPLLCDWDVAAPWRPASELARTALALADWSEPSVVEQVLAGYRSAGRPTGPISADDLALDLVIDLDWLSLCLRRAADGVRTGDPQSGHLRDRVGATVSRLRYKIAVVADIEEWLADPSNPSVSTG